VVGRADLKFGHYIRKASGLEGLSYKGGGGAPGKDWPARCRRYLAAVGLQSIREPEGKRMTALGKFMKEP
jgi:hypothetical protein